MNSISSEWFTILSVITGSAFTLLGVWITNKSSFNRLQTQLEHEKSISEENDQRQRLEELYVLAQKHFNTLFSHHLVLGYVLEGKISFNDFLDQINSTKIDYNPQRLPMLIDLYFNELNIEFEEVMNVNEKLHDIRECCKLQYQIDHRENKKLLPLYKKKLQELSDKSEAAKNKIIKLSKNETA